jgi:uncharacterized protein (DUF433 family)
MIAEKSMLKSPQAGFTVLDRVHQAMILFSTSCDEALEQFQAMKTHRLSLVSKAILCTVIAMEPTTPPVTVQPHEGTSTFPVVTEYIGVRPGYCGGRPHILGHRIKVKHIAIWHEQMGMTPTQIVATYPTITLAQVHAALAYYYDHRDDIQAEIEEERRFVEEMKAKAGPSRLH